VLSIVVASATEVVNGVDNFWKSGPLVGHHAYPDFGQYVPISYSKHLSLQHHFAGL
jgi:hypothetical protein